MFVFLSAVLLLAWSSAVQADYVAAVAEHSVYVGTADETAQSKLQVNLQLYANLTHLAKQQHAQILVFPEFGLTPVSPASREDLYPYLEVVPAVASPFAVPCSDAQFQDTPILQQVSCMAKENKLPVLVNMIDKVACDGGSDKQCPADGHYQFNTDVVMDEAGQFVAKYHKSHEFPTLQRYYDVPAEPSQVTYKSSFGVEFGIFTCFDIMFPDPPKELRKQGIEHFLYPVEQGQLGENTIIEGWSKNNEAVVLSSNLGAGPEKKGGDCSGIIVKGTPLDAKKYHLVHSSFPNENVLIATVPTASSK